MAQRYFPRRLRPDPIHIVAHAGITCEIGLDVLLRYRAADAQLEPIFLLYDGKRPVVVPDRAPDLVSGETRLWRVPGDGVAEASPTGSC